MDDAQLVEAARTGDGDADAAIYDRYADSVHDFCVSILRNRAEAADALQQTFLVAFEGLDTLTEPARLRAWLYALAHRAILDRVERHGADHFADDDDLNLRAGTGEDRLSRAELSEFVWQAASGLDLADRVLLDLHLRQGLEGRDLAGASGVPSPQLDARLPRLEAQVERALGALVVARTGRRSCPELYTVVERGDGQLSAEYRDQITAHVDECERCNSRRRIVPAPLGLLAAAPLAPAPAYLRAVVLGKAALAAIERESGDGRDGVTARVGWFFRRDGFPDLAAGGAGGGEAPAASIGPVFATTRPTRPTTVLGAGAQVPPTTVLGGGAQVPPTTILPRFDPPVPPPGDGTDRRGILVGALAGLIVLIAGVVILLSGRGKSSSGIVGVGTSTTLGASTTAASDTTTVTTVPFIVPTSLVAPTTSAPAVGHLIVGAKSVDLGTSSTTTSVQLGNDGSASLDFTAAAAGTGLTVTPPTGTLASGASQTLMISLDRTANAAGPFTGSILLASAAGNATIAVTATVDPGPMISGETASPPVLSVSGCTGLPTTTTVNVETITAAVSSTQPLQTVVLHWQYTSTTAIVPGTTAMTMSGTVYSGTFPQTSAPFKSPGTVDWWITAIDAAGVTGTSLHHPLQVAAC